MKLVIFDMDGTIIDTIHDIHSSLITTLEHYGFPPVSIEMTKQYVGSGMRQTVINAVGEDNFKDEIESYFRAVYKERMMDNTKLMDGFENILEYIDKHEEIKAVVLSNKIRQIADDMISAFGIQRYFADWFGGDSFGVKKPSPDGILGIMKRYGAKPEETIMIGDSSGDILAGVRAGCKTCFCTYGYGTLKNVKPDFTAGSTSDILKILEAF